MKIYLSSPEQLIYALMGACGGPSFRRGQNDVGRADCQKALPLKFCRIMFVIAFRFRQPERG
jgi:hypothetical protein